MSTDSKNEDTNWKRLEYSEARQLFMDGVKLFILDEDGSTYPILSLEQITEAIIEHDVVREIPSIH